MTNLWHPWSADLVPGPPFSAQRATRHVFNVRDDEFGAQGDGAADDTIAIQRAIDAAGQVGSGTVFVPAGRYLVTGLKLRSGVTMAA